MPPPTIPSPQPNVGTNTNPTGAMPTSHSQESVSVVARDYDHAAEKKSGGIVHTDDIMVQREEHAEAIRPASLVNMSDEEMRLFDKKMVRKMDLVIMPILGILYILNYIDRQALAAAKLQGVMEDLQMTEAMFATAISALFAGYIPFQIPSNLVMAKITRPGLYMCIACVIWGAISAATGAVQTYGQMIAIRVLLGAAEAVFFPGAIYYLSSWYVKQELGKRLAGLFIAQQLGNAFGGLVAAGVLTIDGAAGIASWRWLFIIEGVITVFFGLVFALIMPEYPHRARILSPIQKDYAVWRLEKEAGQGEAHDESSTVKSFALAFKDLRVYVLIFCMMMSQGMGSITNFFPAVVRSMGFNNTVSLLLVAPPYLLACFIFWGLSWWSDTRHTVYPLMMLCLGSISLIYIIPLATVNTGARYFAMMLIPGIGVCPQIFLYKTMNLHVARPYPKRAAGVALMNAIGGTSNVWASYMYGNAPRYYEAFGALLGMAIVFGLVITAYRFFVRAQNRKLDSGDPEQIRKALKMGVTQEMVDMGWRYECY